VPGPLPPERPQLPDRVTMPLLDLVTGDALDQDYVAAARRRAEAGERPDAGEEVADGQRRTPLVGAAVVLAAFGLMIALAAVQTSRDADVAEASRQALVERIEANRETLGGLEDRVDRLGRDIRGLRSSGARLRNQVAETTVDLRDLQLSTGFVDVSGPGLRVTVEDAPDGDAEGRVRSSDLRLLANGLWEAGAEAIAVNGRRFTALTAIGNQGIAVTVNRQPLSPPYVVSAIGDPRTLEADLFTTSTGLQFQSLSERFGFEVTREQVDELRLGAASETQLRLRFVEPAPEPGGEPDSQPGSQPDSEPDRRPDDPQERS